MVDWANESDDVARRLIYGDWPHGSGALPGDYGTMALPVVSVQLAAVLNAALP